jgi:hypothetical protein
MICNIAMVIVHEVKNFSKINALSTLCMGEIRQNNILNGLLAINYKFN